MKEYTFVVHMAAEDDVTFGAEDVEHMIDYARHDCIIWPNDAIPVIKGVEALTEVGGVMWCIPHQGIVDETNGDFDQCDNCETSEDLAGEPCQIVPLFVKGDRS